MTTERIKAVLVDIDGTLLNSNDAHARAWQLAFDRHGIVVDFQSVRPLIGKGGDKVLQELAGIDEDNDQGKAILEDRLHLFRDQMLPQLLPTPGARELLEKFAAKGLRIGVATSAGAQELDGLLRQARINDLITIASTSAEAAHSKPDPDIVTAALKKLNVAADHTVMMGDTPYDIEAARQAGVATIVFRCGGWWSDQQLAGALAIYDHPGQLLARWDQSPLVARLH